MSLLANSYQPICVGGAIEQGVPLARAQSSATPLSPPPVPPPHTPSASTSPVSNVSEPFPRHCSDASNRTSSAPEGAAFRSLSVLMPTEASLMTALTITEVFLICAELWIAGMTIVDASFLIWLGSLPAPGCNLQIMPVALFWQGVFRIVDGLAKVFLILPTHEMMKAAVSAIMVVKHRAAGEIDLALEQQGKYERRERFSAYVALSAMLLMAIAELLDWIVWSVSMRYSFDANLQCGGPVWLQVLEFRPNDLLLVPIIGLAYWIFRAVRKFVSAQIFASQPQSSPSSKHAHV